MAVGVLVKASLRSTPHSTLTSNPLSKSCDGQLSNSEIPGQSSASPNRRHVGSRLHSAAPSLSSAELDAEPDAELDAEPDEEPDEVVEEASIGLDFRFSPSMAAFTLVIAAMDGRFPSKTPQSNPLSKRYYA